MPPQPFLDPAEFPTTPIMTIEEIRKYNPQRHEMEQLTAVTLMDFERQLVVGYKDVSDKEFWCRGHLPFYAIMPGVVMCEAAAQLASVYTRKAIPERDDFIAFGGMDEVRFRGMIRPGERFWLVGRTKRLSVRQMKFDMQGFVDGKLVFHGEIIGIPLDTPAESKAAVLGAG